MTDPKQFTDVIYEVRDRAAWIIINRPKVYNAFRGQTLEEMIQALHLAAVVEGVRVLRCHRTPGACSGLRSKKGEQVRYYGPFLSKSTKKGLVGHNQLGDEGEARWLENWTY